MLKIVEQSGVDFLHIVLGFGCDGESTEQDILQTLALTKERGHFKGCIDLSPLAPFIHEHGDGWLANNRTPMIICNAIEGKKLNKRGNKRVVVGRGIKPTIPLDWLKLGFVFDFKGVWFPEN